MNEFNIIFIIAVTLYSQREGTNFTDRGVITMSNCHTVLSQVQDREHLADSVVTDVYNDSTCPVTCVR